MKLLNLYAGLAGNTELFNDHDITHIEINERVAAILKKRKPGQKVVVTDAHQFLLDHHSEYDFIWTSRPCQTHTRMIRSGKNRKSIYPDFRLYEEIIFLKHNFKGKWIAENVIPYYEPLIPGKKIGRHLFWSNFFIDEFNAPKSPKNFIKDDSPQGIQNLKDWLGIQFEGNVYLETHSPAQALRNCVHPLLGKHVFECAFKNREFDLFNQGTKVA